MPTKEQLGFDVVLDERVGDLALGQVAGDRRPARAAIAADVDIGLEVAGLLVVEDGVDGVGVVQRGLDAEGVAELGHAGRRCGDAPVGAAVLGDLDEPVIGADIDQTLDEGRLGERDDVAVVRGGLVLGHRVDGLDLAEDRQGVAVDGLAEIAG